MSGIYDVFVKISMVNSVSPVLAVISRDLLGLETSVKRLNGFLASGFGKTVIGAGLAALGFKEVVDHAKDLSHELTQLRKLGLDDMGLEKVRIAAVETTKAIKGISEVDALKTFGQAYSMFGSDNAIKLMQPLARYAQVIGNGGDNYGKAQDGVYKMVRAGDLMGKFVDDKTHQIDPARLNGFLDLGARAFLISHGKVNADTWLALAQQGGPALSNMSDQGLINMAIASQAMGGNRAGTALTSLFQQVVGGKMPEYAAKGLHDLGLLGDYKVGRGGHILWEKGALDTPFAKAIKENGDPLEATKMLREALAKNGYDTIEKQVPKLFELLGRQTTQRLVHDFLRNEPQFQAEGGRIKSAMSTDNAKRTQDENDIFQAEQNMKAAWTNLMTAIAGPQSKNAVTILEKIADAFRWMTERVRDLDAKTIGQWMDKAIDTVKGIGGKIMWVWGLVTDGFSSLMAVAKQAADAVISLANAIGQLPERIRAAINGIFSMGGPGGNLGQGERGGGLFGHGGLGAKPGIDGIPLPGKQSRIESHHHIYLDGRQVAVVVESHMANQSPFPTRSPGGVSYALPNYGIG